MIKGRNFLVLLIVLMLISCVDEPSTREVVSPTTIPPLKNTSIPTATHSQVFNPTTIPVETSTPGVSVHCELGLNSVITFNFAEFFVYSIYPEYCPLLEEGGIDWVRDTFSNPNTSILQGSLEETAFKQLDIDLIVDYLETLQGFIDPNTDAKVMYESKNRKELSGLYIVIKMEERQDIYGKTNCPPGWYHPVDANIGNCCPIGFIYESFRCILVHLPTQYCQDQMESQLTPYMLAVVNPEITQGNLLRTSAGVDHSRQGGIMPGEIVKITDGPECADGYTWWYVESTENEMAGWTAEGDGTDYWLIPWEEKEP
jgi:hypothetical protein